MLKLDTFEGRKIGILAGGDSSERDVSIKSGKAVFDAFSRMGLKAVFLDVRENDVLRKITENKVDIVFVALHGKFGEDGSVQELLSGEGIPYTGSNPESSRLAIDKLASKKTFAESGLLVPEYQSVCRGEDLVKVIDNTIFPCVVKPRYEGSSIGLSVVTQKNKLGLALEEAFKFAEDVIIEEFIPGREITVGVLDGSPLPIVEIVPLGGIYDYDSKYVSAMTRYTVPADIASSSAKIAQAAAMSAHNALSCFGFSRTDMRMASDDKFYILEVNTIPGLTEKSLLPLAAKAAGVDFDELCVKMLSSALDRPALS